jgi:hypothetical protein
MKDLRDILKVIIVLGTLVINAVLIYVLLYDPLSQVLVDKNQPYYLPDSNGFIQIVTLLIIGLLILTSFFLLIKIYKKQKVFLIAPLFTLLIICALFMVSFISPKYPGSISGYEKDGYYYKIEIWRYMPNHMIYKRWKSVLPYDGKLSTEQLKYRLDSLSNTR